MPRNNIDLIYFEHSAELRRYLTRRVACAQTAADLTHEAFAKLIKAGPVEALENPRAYIYKIASNLLADHFRGLQREGHVDSLDQHDGLFDDTPGPERAVLSKDQLYRLQQVIGILPRRQRDVLVMHKFEGLNYSQIAERLGISKNTVMVHMMRALARCRDALS
ncbi:MAG: RNA polymerase sigma factor [Pseudomonadota bacterium]